MTTDFTIEDVRILLEAVEEWRSKPGRDFFACSLINVLAGKDSDERDRLAREEKDKFASQEAEHQARLETAALVTAKLVLIRQALAQAEADRRQKVSG